MGHPARFQEYSSTSTTIKENKLRTERIIHLFSRKSQIIWISALHFEKIDVVYDTDSLI